MSRLKDNLAALDAEPLAGASGIRLCRRRTELFDEVVRSLFEPHAHADVALAALGGYGRREMTPGSDVDLLFVHSGGGDDRIRADVDAVLYPLWDEGLPVSHAVRTVDECGTEAEARVESLTSVLDARMLAGHQDLVDAARSAVNHVARRDLPAFCARLRTWREGRDQRFGDAGRMLEPDLKESLGGLRDVALARWVALACGEPEADSWWDFGSVLDDLLLLRTALHRVTSTRATRLGADQHQPVADLLGVASEPGWEARDVLMRDLLFRARWVDCVVDEILRNGTVMFRNVKGMAGIVTDLDSTHPLKHALESLLNPRLSPHPDLLVPGWSGVRGRTQRDPYHRYPVDVHLAETVNEVERLLADPCDPFEIEAAAQIDDPAPLRLGALYHDIGKVGKGSHVDEGVQIAKLALEEMEVQEQTKEDVLFLVREHLLLSDTATRRNLEEEDLVVQVAARIGNRRRLAMLYLLTVADASATGPSAATPWRMTLIRDLVSKVDHVLERGQMDPNRAARLDAAARSVQDALTGAGIPSQEIEAFTASAPTDYLLWVDAAEAPGHLGLVVPPPLPGEVRADIQPGRTSGTHRVGVGAIDRLGLLASVAGSFTLAGLTILAAQAFTTSDGVALDVFDIRGAFEEEVHERRWEKFRSTLRDAFAGADLAERVRSLRGHYRQQVAYVPVEVRVDQEASDFYTLVEVDGPDRIGLLFELASAFAQHGLDVHVAKVSTYGPRVVDVFYLRDEENRKPEEGERMDGLLRDLRRIASGG